MSTTSEILNRLSSAFSKDPDSNLAKYILIIAAELDEFEAAVLQVQAAHQLDQAAGIQLDRVVDLLGIARFPGESDDDFRARAGVLRWLQSSSGTKADLEAIICYLTGYTTDEFEVLENPNAQGNGSGWGRQKWGNSPWGGSYNVGQFKIVFYTAPRGPISLPLLYDAVGKARAASVLFLEDQTTFILTETGIELDLHLIAELEIGYDVSGVLLLTDPIPAGWGRQKWGNSPWGSDGMALGHHETVITPIT
jgi:hypothetical protein